VPYVNIHNRQIELKVVYYGAGLAGKTTNLVRLHEDLESGHRGQMVSLATDSESTVFFDFFPIELGEVHGMQVRLRMYTVPGQDYYEASRRLVLERVDGVVFVVDSGRDTLERNVAAFEDLRRNLTCHGLSLDELPVVFQYNKRDLPSPLDLGLVEGHVGFAPLSVFEAVASEGRGVRQTARAICRSVVERFAL
jgi:signal recognition particle receptor subunit beta